MKRLSYQLYSSRNFGPLSATLGKLAALGYENVEGYGALYAQLADLSGLKALLDENGLKMPSGHFGLDMVKSDPDRVISIADSARRMRWQISLNVRIDRSMFASSVSISRPQPVMTSPSSDRDSCAEVSAGQHVT